MKNLAILMMLLAILGTTITACSPDNIEEAEESALTPEPTPEPQDEDVTIITVGGYATGEQLFDTLRLVRIQMGIGVENALQKPDFPVYKAGEYAVKVKVVTLLEAGFDEPVTIQKIRERFQDLGYRPLTLAEAVATRLQIKQPTMLSGNKMSAFHTLLTEESARWLGNNTGRREGKGAPRVFSIYRQTGQHKKIITQRANLLYDPNKPFDSWDAHRSGLKVPTSFACTVINK